MAEFTLHLGDALERLAEMGEGSVHCVVTSPPYFGLRDYGTGQWEGGAEECDHRLREPDRTHDLGRDRAASNGTFHGGPAGQKHRQYRTLCGKCGARRIDRQLGLEETPALFVAKLVEVFRAVKRVLRDDGTLWVNLGDSYAGNDGKANTNGGLVGMRGPGDKPGRCYLDADRTQRRAAPGLDSKQLLGMPWRVAFALQEDGWVLRSDIVWAKPNPMPESVRDRPTKSHEYIFMFAKRPRYYYDADAVREEVKPNSGLRMRAPRNGAHRLTEGYGIVTEKEYAEAKGANRRTVWTVTPRPFKGAHFATFPPDLVRPCVLAGTSARGACPRCGAPWVRQTKNTPAYQAIVDEAKAAEPERWTAERRRRSIEIGSGNGHPRGHFSREVETTGWLPSCACSGPPEPVPCTVLDPFCGAGGAGVAALREGRSFVGIDLNAAYLDMARRRLGKLQAKLAMPLFDDEPNVPPAPTPLDLFPE